jgi:hypothetical protein
MEKDNEDIAFVSIFFLVLFLLSPGKDWHSGGNLQKQMRKFVKSKQTLKWLLFAFVCVLNFWALEGYLNAVQNNAPTNDLQPTVQLEWLFPVEKTMTQYQHHNFENTNQTIAISLDDTFNADWVKLDNELMNPLGNETWEFKECTVKCRVTYGFKGDEDIIVHNHGNYPGPHRMLPLRASYQSEPRIEYIHDISEHQFILGWYKNSDIFLPPWILHETIDDAKWIWSEEIKRFSFSEKTAMNRHTLCK